MEVCVYWGPSQEPNDTILLLVKGIPKGTTSDTKALRICPLALLCKFHFELTYELATIIMVKHLSLDIVTYNCIYK